MAVVYFVFANVSLETIEIDIILVGVFLKRAVAVFHASAGETAFRFMGHVLVLETGSDFIEVSLPVLHFDFLQVVAGAFRNIAKLRPARFGPEVLARNEWLMVHFLTAEIAVNGLGRDLSVPDGVNDHRGSVVRHVSPGKEAFDVGLHGFRIIDNSVPPGQFGVVV